MKRRCCITRFYKGSFCFDYDRNENDDWIANDLDLKYITFQHPNGRVWRAGKKERNKLLRTE